ncbi:MAG: glycosyltransferase family 29 protein [Defluviitaleaceae bacterium]|nr:glycosyltransferase family 29 protein [Defluviitaleaceae bacterium]MCL2238348.1 glycosyltransferase family 29 protein [Defluviitaleaceae bacterium]
MRLITKAIKSLQKRGLRESIKRFLFYMMVNNKMFEDWIVQKTTQQVNLTLNDCINQQIDLIVNKLTRNDLFETYMSHRIEPQANDLIYYAKHRRILFSWYYYWPNNMILHELENLALSHWSWKYEYKQLWLIYCACLLDKGRDEEAERVLKRYEKLYKKHEIEQLLPVADFASRIGISNDSIEKSSLIYKMFQKNKKTNHIVSYMKDKKIAVVSNGDACLGKGLGKEIDANDIVVRFNCFDNTARGNDYGNKTSIWVKCLSVQDEDKNIENMDYVLYSWDVNRFFFSENHLNILYDYACSHHDKLTYIDGDLIRSLLDDSLLTISTSGCNVFYYLYKLFGNFHNINAYGFSFLTLDYDNRNHYYENKKIPDELAKFNDLYTEYNFLNNLYFNNKE